jgi:hypothetical protein
LLKCLQYLNFCDKVVPSGKRSKLDDAVGLLLGAALNAGQFLGQGIIEEVQNFSLVVRQVGNLLSLLGIEVVVAVVAVVDDA